MDFRKKRKKLVKKLIKWLIRLVKWTLGKREKDEIEAFEMAEKPWRKTEKIKWLDGIGNEEMLIRVKKKKNTFRDTEMEKGIVSPCPK